MSVMKDIGYSQLALSKILGKYIVQDVPSEARILSHLIKKYIASHLLLVNIQSNKIKKRRTFCQRVNSILFP